MSCQRSGGDRQTGTCRVTRPAHLPCASPPPGRRPRVPLGRREPWIDGEPDCHRVVAFGARPIDTRPSRATLRPASHLTGGAVGATLGSQPNSCLQGPRAVFESFRSNGFLNCTEVVVNAFIVPIQVQPSPRGACRSLRGAASCIVPTPTPCCSGLGAPCHPLRVAGEGMPGFVDASPLPGMAPRVTTPLDPPVFPFGPTSSLR